MRAGAGTRLIGAMIGLVGLTAAASGIGIERFLSFQQGFERVSNEYLPLLGRASALAQQSQTLVANAPALVVAESQFARRTVAFRIEDQLSVVRKLIADLETTTAPRETLLEIETLRDNLVANLRALDKAVEQRLRLERQVEELNQSLTGADSQIKDMMVALQARSLDRSEGRNAFAPHAFATDAGRIAHLLRTAGNINMSRSLVDLNGQIESGLAELGRRAATLPGEDQKTALEILARLQEVGIGAKAIPLVEVERLQAMRAIQAGLSSNRVLADRFVAAVQKLVEAVRADALATSDSFRIEIAQGVTTLIGILVGCLAAAALLALYVWRAIVGRLTRLSWALRDGRGSESMFHMVRGKDEIADLALALDEYAGAIAARERMLMDNESRLQIQNTALRALGSGGTPQSPGPEAFTTLADLAAATLQVSRVSFWTLVGAGPDRLDLSGVGGHAGRGGLPAQLPCATITQTLFTLDNDGDIGATEAVTDARLAELKERWILPAGVQSLLLVAVRFHGKLHGAVAFERLDEEKAWQADELNFADSIANHVEQLLIEEEREIATRQMLEAKLAAETALKELHLAQASLVQAEKMASLGQLVAGVAHEVNTPVGITLSAASQLGGEVEKMRDTFSQGQMTRADFEDFLTLSADLSRLMLSNSQRAADLIQSFKNVAVDQSSSKRRSFDLHGYVDEVLTSLLPKLRKSPHKVVVNIPAGITLDSYPGALSQIVTNMVLNALNHAFQFKPAGTLTISARLVPPGQAVEITFADDGSGIPAVIQSKIFDPFFTTARGRGGSGLGLHIVYNLVTTTLGGSITLISAEGQGATFILLLPVVAPRSTAEAA